MELRRWQAEALPRIIGSLRARKRPIVSAVMGAGKSVLMAEVIGLALQKSIERNQVVLVVAPRRKLVEQLSSTIGKRVGFERVGVYHADEKQPFRHVVVTTASSMGQVLDHQAKLGRSVSLLVADECHGTEGEGLKTWIQQAEPICQVGFTATPMRSVRGERLELWDEVVYRYTMEEALRDGVLVPMRVVRQEGTENRPLDEACLEMIREHCKGPGIISARSIEDAEAYAAWLKERGVRAEAIHSALSQETQGELLCRLRACELDCLVHVSLLAEGVDFPWLRWICLRRKVGASVRFLQEIGRPMRAEDGKTECVVVDPHLLLGRFGLRPAEAIGKALEAAAEENELSEHVRAPGQPTPEEAIALEGLLDHLEALSGWLVQTGVHTERRFEGGTGWQLADITPKQVDALKSAGRLTRHVPEKHRAAIKALMHVPWALNRGQATSLLGVLYAGTRWARAEAERRNLNDRQRWALKWDEMPGDELGEETAKVVERGVKRMEREREKNTVERLRIQQK